MKERFATDIIKTQIEGFGSEGKIGQQNELNTISSCKDQEKTDILVKEAQNDR